MYLKLLSLIVLLMLLSGTVAQQMIYTCTDLQNIQSNLAGNYALANDIDCSATVNWNGGAGFVPIGHAGGFSGTFNGQGHTISHLFINYPSVNYNVGLFGYAILAQISAVGLIGGNTRGGNSAVGSLVGYSLGSTITRCYATGNVTGSSILVGGLVGWSTGTIARCYATGNVSAPGSEVGGLAGENDGIIALSYATGNVFGSGQVGGLVGYNYGATNTAYSTGKVSASANFGGLVGINGGTVVYAYWDIQTSQQPLSPGGASGQTTQSMQQPSTFFGWDFVTNWVINPGRTYPLLQVFMLPPVLSYPLTNVTQYIGTLFQFTIPANTFTDPNGLLLTYSAGLIGGYPLPTWLIFKPSTQTFVGTPLSGAQSTLVIDVSAYNTPSQLTSTVWQLTIPNRPSILNAPFTPQYALNGQPFQFIVPDVTFLDPDGDRLQLSATINQSAPLPGWLSFNAALMIFSGTATHRGNLWVNVTANDGFGGQASTLLEIITPNTAPQATGIFSNQVITIAQPFNFTIPASLFSDLDGDPLTYSATLFGGGQLLSWLNFNSQTLMFQGTPDAIGFLLVSVIATDTYNASDSLNFGISISALAGKTPPSLAIQMLDQTAFINQPFVLALPANMFIDTNSNPLTYSAMLEGGAPLPNWLNFSATSLVFSGVAPTIGSLHITIRADNGGGFALDTFTLTILTDQQLPPFLENPISNQVVSVSENFQFTLPSNTFTDVNNAALTYTTETSGGGALPHWLHFNANTRTFAGTPSDTDTNIYAPRIIMIEVRASNGIGSAIATFQLSVNGKSQAEIIINALITLASVASTAFAIYRNRAFLWNTFFKKQYEKEPKEIGLNEVFTYKFSVPSKKIMGVQVFNQASHPPLHKTFCGRGTWCSCNLYQELHDYNKLPEWLQFNRETLTLSGTATEPAALYICAEGFDGRYLEAFKLRCGEPQGKDVEMHNV